MKKLTDKHPTSIKLEKLFTAMEDLGLTITVSRWGQYIVCDRDQPGKDYLLNDSDNGESVTILPPDLEYKVVTD